MQPKLAEANTFSGASVSAILTPKKSSKLKEHTSPDSMKSFATFDHHFCSKNSDKEHSTDDEMLKCDEKIRSPRLVRLAKSTLICPSLTKSFSRRNSSRLCWR